MYSKDSLVICYIFIYSFVNLVQISTLRFYSDENNGLTVEPAPFIVLETSAINI